MKNLYLLTTLIILGFLSISSNASSQEYINYQVKISNLHADVTGESFKENPVWKISYRMASSPPSGQLDYLKTYANTAEYSSGADYDITDAVIWSGTCLDDKDNLYVYVEAWEDDNIPINTTYDPVWDDDYRTKTNTDNNINSNITTRNTWLNYNSGYAYAGTIGATNGDYRAYLKVLWDWTMPDVSCDISNTSYGSFDINMTSGNYRVTSWEYEVSTTDDFLNIVSSSTTSGSSITATGLAPLTQYWVRIKGTNEGGAGSFSGTKTTTTPDAVTEPNGDGTEGNPYQIADITNLNWLVQTSSAWDKYFIQTADIEADGTSEWNSGKGISMIGNSSTKFTGVYEGNNKTISGLSNSSLGSTEGLFGYVYLLAEIKNLGLINANYTGGSNTGLLVGKLEAESIVINCYSSGSVDGHQSVGGLIGSANSSTISNCYSNATVTGSSECGGLIGLTLTSSISNSYATGNTTADGTYGNTGGLVGYFHNYSNMINCYSTGTPSVANGNIGGLVGQKGSSVEAINCFWDTQTSGQPESDVGTGKTTAAMKTQSTFTNALWDFTSPIWSIDGGTNNGYPNLENNTLVHVWVGTLNGYWNYAANWSTGSIPTASDDVFISDSRHDAIIDYSATSDCKNLNILEGASLTLLRGASIIPTGTITNNGTFNMQHSMSDGEWHFVSSPVEGATANLFYGDYLQYYDETLPEDNYVDISDENTELSACKGFSWRNFNKGDFTFIGDPHHGDQSIATTANNTWGWNLVGNPYPSSIDWDMLDDTYGTVYLWTGTDNEFSTYNAGATTNGGTRYIAPMQGFLIITSVPEAPVIESFSVNNTHRTHSGANGYVKSAKILPQYLKLKIEDGNVSDEVFIQFGDSYSDGFELNDGFKILTSNPENINIYTKTIDGNLSIDRRPECESIQMGIKSDQSKQLIISKIESADLVNIQLEDTKLNTIHDLSNGGYSFDWNTTDSEERFILHLKATGTEETEVQEAQVYSYDGQIYIRQTSSMDFQSVNIFDLAGRVIYSGNLNQDELQSIHLSNLKGAYLVQLINKDVSQTTKVILK